MIQWRVALRVLRLINAVENRVMMGAFQAIRKKDLPGLKTLPYQCLLKFS